MITKTYTCDRCKASDTTGQIELIPIKIFIFSFNDEKRSAEWCRKCMNEVGLIDDAKMNGSKPEKIIEPPPTIEELIREIVREELQQ